MATAAECMSKRFMDQVAGTRVRFHILATDMPSTTLRNLAVPITETAWRTELTLLRRAYRAEFTTCRRFPAMTASFSIRSPSLENDTSSPASDANRRFMMGENGGRSSKPRRALAFRGLALGEFVLGLFSAAGWGAAGDGVTLGLRVATSGLSGAERIV